MALTPKQQTFCEEYLIDLNATQAAIRSGYSKKTANRIASQLLSKLDIQTEIQRLRGLRAERTAITSDKVVKELARIGFSDIANCIEWDGERLRIKPLDEMGEDVTASISEFSETVNTSGSSYKFKLYDKKGALELLGRHLGMYGGSGDDGQIHTVDFEFEPVRNDDES